MSTGVERRVTLAPAPDSARTARRLVAEVLSAARAEHFTDTAALLTSELVTNGIVHANTELEVVVDATPRWVRVEVVDGNPRLPARRDYDEIASTGHGLEMVELLADEFGVEPLQDAGKRVWFRLGQVPGTPEPPAAGGDRAAGDDPDVSVRIRLLAVPVALYCAWQQHAEALLREATLASFDDPTVSHEDYPLATRTLATLADAAGEAFVLRDRGVALADLDIDLTLEAVHRFPIVRDLLARATAMAAVGDLLTPPSLPEIVAVRRWVCDEIARQAAGLPPTPWAEQAVDDPAPPHASESILDEVRGATDSLVAADSANRIVAVSASAAELLGWQQDELAGKRLVTIIPPDMRDRHIAGFTRHLVEGTGRIIGRTVPVTALRRDGSTVDIDLHIERRADGGTRGLFVATLSPR